MGAEDGVAEHGWVGVGEENGEGVDRLKIAGQGWNTGKEELRGLPVCTSLCLRCLDAAFCRDLTACNSFICIIVE